MKASQCQPSRVFASVHSHVPVAKPSKPTEGAFNDPASRQQHEAFLRFGMLHHLSLIPACDSLVQPRLRPLA